MKKFFCLLIFCLVVPLTSHAAYKGCGGKTTMVMGGHYKCNGFLAIETEKFGSVWMCSNGKDADSVVLSSFAAGWNTSVSINDAQMADGECTTNSHYVAFRYIIA